MSLPPLDAVFEEVGSTARAMIVRRGAAFAQERVMPHVARGLSAVDAAGPSFSTGATVVIAGTCAALGAVAGWKLRDFMKGRKR